MPDTSYDKALEDLVNAQLRARLGLDSVVELIGLEAAVKLAAALVGTTKTPATPNWPVFPAYPVYPVQPIVPPWDKPWWETQPICMGVVHASL